MPFMTGDTIPSTFRCKVIRIPDDLAFLDALNGALLELTYPSNFEQEGNTLTPQQMADAFSTAYDDYTTEACMEIPVGTISMWAVATPPAKWKICSAQSLLRADYPELFAVIGTTYGAVDGTHFTTPDFKDYSPMGAASTVGLGAAAGTFLQAISPGQMPTHNHGITDPGHAHLEQNGGSPAYLAVGGTPRVGFGAVTTSSSTRVTTDSATTGITTQNAGSSTPLNMLHPVKGVHFIIYAGR
jgi:microcystin-dependent protein